MKKKLIQLFSSIYNKLNNVRKFRSFFPTENAAGSPKDGECPSRSSVDQFFWDWLYAVCNFLFYLGFLSRTFTIQKTSGERRGYLFRLSLPLPPLHKHLDISRAITSGSSPLRIACSRTRTGNLWFPSANG